MNNEDDEDKYMLDTNTEYSEQKISVASWVMVCWIIIFCGAISFAIWLSVK